MKVAHFQIALAKATQPQAAAALRAMEPLFVTFVELHTSFAQRIEASKAARGEAPTKLSKARRQDLQGYAQDAEEIDRQVTEQLRALSAAEIVESLRTGLRSDLTFWKGSLKHFHAAELPLGREYVDSEQRLIEAMDRYLSEFADAKQRDG